MKKFLKFLCALLLLAGCAGGGNNSQGSGGNSLPPSEEPHVSQPSEEEPPIMFEMEYESTEWSRHLLKAIAVITGEDRVNEVPQVVAEKYVYGATLYNTGETFIDLVVIRCYGVQESSIEEDYESALISKGYQISYENPVAYLEFSVTEDLVVQYMLREDTQGNKYFELLVLKQELRIAEWPAKLIENSMGVIVPEVQAVSYEVMSDLTFDNKVRLNVYAYHLEMTQTEYEQALVDAGFVLKSSVSMNEAVSADGWVHIMYSFYEPEQQASLYIYNDWPYIDLVSTIGMDLPKLDSSLYSSFEFSFVTLEGYQILTLYFNGVGETGLATYGGQLEALGFVLDGDEVETTSGEGADMITVRSRGYVLNDGAEDEHYLQAMYCVEQESLAIAVYY